MHLYDLLRNNTLRGSRERCALYQAEVGALLGLSDDAIGNYETGRRAPALSIALGLELIFGRSLLALYPGLARSVAEELLPRLQKLSVEIETEENAAREDRQKAVTAIGERLGHYTPLA
jgi:DNA-binding XRE family transcriptional regulator